MKETIYLIEKWSVFMAHVIREISIKDVENFIDLLSKIYDESDFTFIILVSIHQALLLLVKV